PRSRSWEGNYSGRGRRSERNTGRRHGVNRPRTSSARSRDLCRNWKRENIGWSYWRSQTLPAGKVACAKKRNRRVEGDIRQHRKKHQSQVQTSKILKVDLCPSFELILYPFAFILFKGRDPGTAVCFFPLPAWIIHPCFNPPMTP